jgi:hypothetical protein
MQCKPYKKSLSLIGRNAHYRQLVRNNHRMNLKYSVLIASGLLVGSTVAYSASSVDRRNFVSKSITGVVGGSIPFFTSVSSTMAAEDEAGVTADDGFITTDSGLRYKVITVGTGGIPSPGQTVKTHYTGNVFPFTESA